MDEELKCEQPQIRHAAHLARVATVMCIYCVRLQQWSPASLTL